MYSICRNGGVFHVYLEDGDDIVDDDNGNDNDMMGWW